MKYIFGIDGGGTKTHCYIGNEEGSILGEGFGGPCNYQICGIDVTRESIKQALFAALKTSGIELEQLNNGVLGLSGADDTIDYKILNELCKEILGDIKFEVLNDTWIGLRTGASFGIVSICGTGAAHAGKNQKGKSIILRNLTYEIGNRGGGGDLVPSALHYAFRSDEGTYKKSILEKTIPSLFGLDSLDEVCDYLRKNDLSSDIQYQIPIKVLEHALEGDEVCSEIVAEMGYTEGRYGGAIAKKLSLEDSKVPVVLIGSIFKTRHKVLIDAYMKGIHESAPLAYPVFPEHPPVYGALLLAKEVIQC